MNKDHPKWSYNQFLAFLLIHTANADMEFTEDEKDTISKVVTPEELDIIKSEYDAASDYEVIQIILTYKGLYYPTIDRKQELLREVIKECCADGDYSALERNLTMFLRKLM